MDHHQLAEIQTSYDRLAVQYAEHIAGELAGKPLDRQFLDRFADSIRALGPACDIGCGPGHVARYLHERGVAICGIDLSAQMIQQARRLNPDIEFRQGDLFALDAPDGAWAGLVAFYSIVHIPAEDMPQAFLELRRVLRPGGWLLLAFHVGTESVRPEKLWGVPVALEWRFFTTNEIVGHLRTAGFTVSEVIERPPYEGVEHPSQRAYVLATRP